MTLPVSRRGLGVGVAALVPLLTRGVVELARRPLASMTATGPELHGRRLIFEDRELGPVHVRHVPGPASGALVLVHGWSGCADVSWYPVIPHLLGGPSIYAVDLPGHGEAPARKRFSLEDAAARIALVCERASVHGPVTLVGYSMGGAASLTGFHLGMLGSVDRYVAVATADRFATPSLSAKLWAARILGAGDRSPFILREAWKRTRISRRELVAWIYQHRPHSRVLAQTAAVMADFDLSGAEIALPAETRWLVPELDTVVPVEEQVSSAVRHDVPVTRIQACHAVTMEHPVDLARILGHDRSDRPLSAD